MSHALPCIAALLLLYAALEPRLGRANISQAMFFTVTGLVVGPVLEIVHLHLGSHEIKLLAEITLVLLLFSDASRLSLTRLRRSYGLPIRLLGLGLPLTIVIGALVGLVVLPQLAVIEAVVLAVMLACTDAALGKSVVVDPRVPSPIRQALNIESGLNDGLCVPIFLVALSLAEVDQSDVGAGAAFHVLADQLGLGALAGVVAGLAGAVALRAAAPPAGATWGQILTVAVAALAAGTAHAWGGSIFIAAFVAGVATSALSEAGGRWAGRTPTVAMDDHTHLLEQAGELCNGVAFIVFGAVILPVAFDHLTWRAVAYAVLSLTVVRMLPVAIALAGTRASRATVAYVGWFGPRGLASIVFGVMLLDDSSLSHESTLLNAVAVTVALSVLAHGLSAGPLTDLYVGTLARSDGGGPPDPTAPEHGEVPVPRWRSTRVVGPP